MEHNEAFVKGVSTTLKNCKLFYAKVTPGNEDEYKGKRRYKVTLLIEDKEVMDKFETWGMNVKETSDGDRVIDAFSNCTFQDGTERKPPAIKFENGEMYDSIEHGFIANETVADVNVTLKYAKVGKTTHLPLYLDSIVITDFIPYGGKKVDVKDLF